MSSAADASSSTLTTTAALPDAVCDTVTRQLITVLLSISDWTSQMAKRLNSGNADGRCRRFSSMLEFDGRFIGASMSSVASKQALIIALGGVSIAALFVWYIQTKREEERKRKKSTALNDDVNAESNNLTTIPNSSSSLPPSINKNGGSKKAKRNKRTSESNGTEIQMQKENGVRKVDNDPKTKSSDETTTPIVDVENTTKPNHQESELVVIESQQNGFSKEVETASIEVEKREEAEKLKESEKEEKEEIAEETEEEKLAQKVEVKPVQTSAPTAIIMPQKKKTIESEQIPEEPTPTKILDQPLSLDIFAQMSPASWSEEMENCKEFEGVNDDSDAEHASPSKTLKSNMNSRNRKGGAKPIGAINGNGKDKKSQRRLSQQQQQQPQLQKPQQPPQKINQVNGVAGNDEYEKENQHKTRRESSFEEAAAAGDACNNNNQQHQKNVDENVDENYEKSNSPGLDSQNSEASSQDSGRATGGLASSLSPVDENGQGIHDEFGELLPMYEFEIPNSLVGLVIGVKGKTIKELSLRTNVRMLIRQHHTPEKVKTHQICQVRGKREEINRCLQILRRRFPSPRFPELNLQPVLPPPIPNNNFDMLSTQPTWLTLPEEIRCEIAVSSIIDPSHFFVQQPTHPSFASLRYLDLYMLQLYGENSNLPEMPIPCQNGLLCAAPVGNAWFRAVTVQYYDETDEVFVKFVDYGGYSKMSRQDLRQIRTDLMSLPFQSTEVMLAHCRPVDGTANWSEAAMEEFSQLCTGKVITCKLVGYAVETRIPMIELFVTVKEANGDETEYRFDQYLMERGLARTADPSKMVKPSKMAVLAQHNGAKRPSLSSQTSQTTIVC